MTGLQYLPDEVDQALLALIATGDNATRALDLLKQAGVENVPSRATLRKWADSLHADRYVTLQTEQAPKIAERIAGQAEGLALVYNALEAEIAERLKNEVKNLKPADLSGAVRNIATAKALQIDKISSPLRGRPSSIVEHRDPKQAAQALARRLGVAIESTAVEILPAELSPAT